MFGKSPGEDVSALIISHEIERVPAGWVKRRAD
jgi:hypothetical protein